MVTIRSDVSPVMQELSTYIATALRKPVPAEVRERARIHLVDTIAAIISGSRLLPGKRATAYVKTLGGTKEAGVMGTRIVTTAVNAALANGIFGHADETDDSHAAGMWHPGASVVSACFAIGERNGASGSALLRAMVLGYDIGARMTMSLGAISFFLRGHHPPSFAGLFGAAAAAGALCRLNAERVRTMLSYTAQQAGGIACLLRDPEHVEKAFDMGGMTAHNGTQAALFAAHGFTGVADVFSGDRNFFATYCPEADRTELTRGLGATYEIVNASIKKWPVGAPIIAAMDVLETLKRDHSFSADEVEKLVVTLPEKEAAIVDRRAAPDISIQHLIALVLLDGRLSFKSAHDFRRMHDPRVVELKGRVQLVGSAEMTDAKRRWRGAIEIHLRDGRVLRHATDAARGSSYNPVTREEEDAKARELLIPVMGKARALALLDAAWNIEKIRNVREMRKLYAV